MPAIKNESYRYYFPGCLNDLKLARSLYELGLITTLDVHGNPIAELRSRDGVTWDSLGQTDLKVAITLLEKVRNGSNSQAALAEKDCEKAQERYQRANEFFQHAGNEMNDLRNMKVSISYAGGLRAWFNVRRALRKSLVESVLKCKMASAILSRAKSTMSGSAVMLEYFQRVAMQASKLIFAANDQIKVIGDAAKEGATENGE